MRIVRHQRDRRAREWSYQGRIENSSRNGTALSSDDQFQRVGSFLSNGESAVENALVLLSQVCNVSVGSLQRRRKANRILTGIHAREDKFAGLRVDFGFPFGVCTQQDSRQSIERGQGNFATRRLAV
jgi:hypothetical protein